MDPTFAIARLDIQIDALKRERALWESVLNTSEADTSSEPSNQAPAADTTGGEASGRSVEMDRERGRIAALNVLVQNNGSSRWEPVYEVLDQHGLTAKTISGMCRAGLLKMNDDRSGYDITEAGRARYEQHFADASVGTTA